MKSSNPQQPAESKSIRTLIADDSNLVRAMLVDFLASLPGIQVVGAAADGKAALALMRGQKTDLVVMDLNMPHLDGLQTMLRIREEHPGTRVILMSMSCTAAIRERSVNAGVDAFISKEDIHHDLAQAIARLFPASEPPDPPTGHRDQP